jgi:hypothetical protein
LAENLSDGQEPETANLSGNTREELEKGSFSPKTHAAMQVEQT